MRISGGERFMAALGYILFLFLIPVKLRRDSMFVQFHARQGGVLFGLFFVVSFILFVALLFAGPGLAATVLIGVFFLVLLLYVVFALIGLLKVALGERYRMPLVADVALMLRL
jgi:uncharacterized membrane protein